MKIGTSPLAAVLIMLGTLSCAAPGPSPSTTSTLDTAALQAFLSRNVGNLSIVYDGLSRIIAAAGGSQSTGVTFTNIPGGVQGMIGYDLDGNGTMESSINAKLIYNDPAVGINSGGTFTVTQIYAPYISGNATLALAISGGGAQVSVTSGTADFRPTWGPEIVIPSISLAISPTLQKPTVLGHADFSVGNDQGTVFFENNGSGGWRMRVTGQGFATFTVP